MRGGTGLRRTFVIALAVALTAALAPASLAGKECGRKPLKVLFLVNGCCHDFEKLPPMLAEKFKATGKFEFTITEDRQELIPSRIEKYDLALFFTQGSDMTPEQEKGLTEFVSKGKGLAGIHSASDSFKNSDAYFKLLGGRFKGHGGGKFPVHFTARRNEVVKGMEDFEIQDETYDHEFHPDAKLLILARRDKDSEPAVWIQYYGEGRVFYTGLGHGKEAWENPSFQKLMLRGLLWAAKRPVSETPRAACQSK